MFNLENNQIYCDMENRLILFADLIYEGYSIINCFAYFKYGFKIRMEM